MAKEKENKTKEVQKSFEAKGKRSFSDFTSFLEDDGVWKVVVRMGEAISWDGETWEEESIEAMCFDNDLDKAFNTARESAFETFNEEVLLQGFDSLYEARRAKKAIEVKSE